MQRVTIRMALGLLALGLMAACAAPPPPMTGFRDPAAPFASTQRFEADRFLGNWVQVAAFAAPGEAITPQTHLYRRATTGQIVADITDSGGATRREVYDLVAPGRLRPRGQDTPPGDLWVLWVDEGFRTAVLGTPSGARAFILDRSAAPAPDRLRAAREILDWYGYDMTRLQSAR
ncbi:lipocalin family protein [Seohaeicola saemankumensis]|uniref:Lipocalin family protein n=1 Tax=Seohaeicola saemankumensis TaxID=481181 RepID=A0ABW3TAX0_9RHOB